jgi:hypothetical protein
LKEQALLEKEVLQREYESANEKLRVELQKTQKLLEKSSQNVVDQGNQR